MSEAPTSKESFAEVKDSGSDSRVRNLIIADLKAFGPMTEFEIKACLRGITESTTPRIDELLKKRIAGTMPQERTNPKTNKPAVVYGLIADHGATPRFEDDRIEIKYREKRTFIEVDFGVLQTIDDNVAVSYLRSLLAQARAQESL